MMQERLMTVDEFEKIYMDRPYELIEGQVVKVSPTAYLHGSVASRVDFELRLYARMHQNGDVVAAETGFRLSEITMRAPDTAFIGNTKLRQIVDQSKYLPFAPDLAVEVVSPNDRATKIQQKIDLFMAAQTPLIWVIYLDVPRVVVYTLDKAPKTVLLDGILDGGEVLPGLQIRVADLFPPNSVANEADEA